MIGQARTAITTFSPLNSDAGVSRDVLMDVGDVNPCSVAFRIGRFPFSYLLGVMGYARPKIGIRPGFLCRNRSLLLYPFILFDYEYRV